MKVKDFDDFSYPKRNPWFLILLVLLVLGVLFIKKCGREEDHHTGTQVDVTVEDHSDRQVSTPSVPREQEQVVREKATETVPPAGQPDKSHSFPADSADNLRAMVARAAECAEKGTLVEARKKYLKALSICNDGETRRMIEKKLGDINILLLTTPRAMPEKQVYIVKPGDFLQKIAGKYGTTVDLIQISNELENPDRIKPGDILRVFNGKFELTISKTDNDLLLTMNGEFFKRYRVGTGKYGKTPEGTFEIVDRQKEPVWWPQGREVPFGDPDNILGTRWMGLRATGDTPDVKGYGIHGTWDPSSIGKSESAGCIRLENTDVEELFLMLPVKTPVTITK